MTLALRPQPPVEVEGQTTAAWNPALSWSHAALPKNKGNIVIIRDDRLPGGTKQRAAVPYISRLRQNGINTCVYASPPSGYAQVALANSCQIAGVNCVIFAEMLDGRMSSVTRTANRAAAIQLCSSLAEAEIDALAYASQRPDTLKIPLGLASADFQNELFHAISNLWFRFTQQIRRQPDRVWLPVGSGTLLAIMRSLLPESCRIIAVDVGVLHANDKRIHAARNTSNTEYFRLDLPFSAPAVVQPPVPSNRYYDAKLWQVIRQHAQDGDVWWNVAK